MLDLRDGGADRQDAPQAFAQGTERRVPARLLAALLTSVSSEQGGWRPLHVAGAHITGVLDLRGAALTRPLVIEDSDFEGELLLSEAAAISVRLRRCKLVGMRAHDLRATLDVRLDGCTVDGNVELTDARVGGRLDIVESIVMGRLNLAAASARYLTLAFSTVEGEVLLPQVSVARRLLVVDSSLGPLGMDHMEVGSDAVLRDVVVQGHLRSRDSMIRGGLTLSSCRVSDDLSLRDVRVGQDLTLLDTAAAGGIDLRDAVISRDLRVSSELGMTSEAVDGRRIRVEGVTYLEVADCRYDLEGGTLVLAAALEAEQHAADHPAHSAVATSTDLGRLVLLVCAAATTLLAGAICWASIRSLPLPRLAQATGLAALALLVLSALATAGAAWRRESFVRQAGAIAGELSARFPPDVSLMQHAASLRNTLLQGRAPEAAGLITAALHPYDTPPG